MAAVVVCNFGKFFAKQMTGFVGQFYWQTKAANFIYHLTSPQWSHNRSCNVPKFL